VKEKGKNKPKFWRHLIWFTAVCVGVIIFIGMNRGNTDGLETLVTASTPQEESMLPSSPPLDVAPFVDQSTDRSPLETPAPLAIQRAPTNISWFDNPEEQRCWLRILNDQKPAMVRDDGTPHELQFGNGLRTHICWCWGLVVREFDPNAGWDGERTANGTYVFQGQETFNQNNLLIVDPAHFVAHYDYDTDTAATITFEGTFSYRSNRRAAYIFADAGTFNTLTADGTIVLRNAYGEWDMDSFEEDFEIWTMLLNAFQTQTSRVAAIMLPWERDLQTRLQNQNTRLPISNLSDVGQLGYNWEMLLTTPRLRTITEAEHSRGFFTPVMGLDIHICWCYGVAVNRFDSNLNLDGQELGYGIRAYQQENNNLVLIDPTRFIAYHNYEEGYTITLGEDGTVSIRTNGGRQGYYFYAAGGVVGSTTTSRFIPVASREGVWNLEAMFAHDELDWVWAINRKHSFMSHVLSQMLPWNSEVPW